MHADVSDEADTHPGDVMRPRRVLVPPRPTNVPEAVLSRKHMSGLESTRTHLGAPTHPTLDLPRWQTHLTPMQHWELRGQNLERNKNFTKATNRMNPRLRVQRQHDFARLQKSRIAMLDTIDSLDSADAARRAETNVIVAATAAATAEPRAEDPNTNASSDATHVSIAEFDNSPPPVVDPFVSLFASAMQDDEDDEDETETDTKSDTSGAEHVNSSSSQIDSPRLETPFLDSLVREVTRAKGSVLAELSAVDALWDGRSVLESAPADESAWGLGVRIQRPMGIQSDDVSGVTGRTAVHRPQQTRPHSASARRFLERRLLKSQTPKKTPESKGKHTKASDKESRKDRTLPRPTIDSDDTRFVVDFEAYCRLNKVEGYGKDLETFQMAQAQARNALAAAAALECGESISGTLDDDEVTNRKENSADSFAWERMRPDVRYVADYEVNEGGNTSENEPGPETVIDAAKGETLPSMEDGNKENTSSDLLPFESLPLHFSTKARMLYYDFDFAPLKPLPPPPRSILANAFVQLGVQITRRDYEEWNETNVYSQKKKKKSKKNGVSANVSNLKDASDTVVSKLDVLIGDLHKRDSNLIEESKRHTLEQQVTLGALKKKIQHMHEDALASYQISNETDASELNIFESAVCVAVSQTVHGVMDSTRWWYGQRIRAAATTIQSGFRGWKGRKIAKIRRKGLRAGIAYLNSFILKFRFDLWRLNATTQKRHLMLTKTLDNQRKWSLRANCFKYWRKRSKQAQQFYAQVDRLAKIMRVKYHSQPAFVSWRKVTKKRISQRLIATRLLRRSRIRTLTYNFQKWSRIAAGSARARILDTAAHASAALAATQSYEQTYLIAKAAWAAADAAAEKARAGKFINAQRFAERARTLAQEAKYTCEAAEQHAKETGYDAGPKSRARLAWSAFSAARESYARAEAAAVAAYKSADFKYAARLFYCRVVTRRLFKVWKEYVTWMLPLREKAAKAMQFFKRSSTGAAFHKWLDVARHKKAEREAEAIRKYADIHRRLVAKYVRRAGAPSGGNRGVPGKGESTSHVERVLKSFGAQRLKVNTGSKTHSDENGSKSSGKASAMFDGPSAAAARAEARKILDEEKNVLGSRKLDRLEVGRRTREWNSSL